MSLIGGKRNFNGNLWPSSVVVNYYVIDQNFTLNSALVKYYTITTNDIIMPMLPKTADY